MRRKVHYRDSVRWPDGVHRDIPTCMVERRPIPEGHYVMSSITVSVTCERCWKWIMRVRS